MGSLQTPDNQLGAKRREDWGRDWIAKAVPLLSNHNVVTLLRACKRTVFVASSLSYRKADASKLRCLHLFLVGTMSFSPLE